MAIAKKSAKRGEGEKKHFGCVRRDWIKEDLHFILLFFKYIYI